jgi:amino acid transporter/nucleotide-binding universal stress UspA family protein
MTTERKRTLGFKEAFAIGLGTMIAAGIFSLSGQAVSAVGSTAVLSFVIAAVVAGVTAIAYSEFASIYSESGGGYLFSSRTFENDYLVFAEGIMLFFGYTATTAFYLATAGEWIHQFIFSAIPPWVSGVIIATLLGILNARGTEESGTFQVIVSAAKVIVLIIFIMGVFLYKPPGEAVSTFVTEIYIPTDSISVGEWASEVGRIASLAFITFFGFSAIAASAGEIKNPKRTVPLSIAASIVTVTILYAFVIFAMVNSPVDPQILAEQGETAMGEVAAAYLGNAGRWLIVAGAIFSMASASNASILAASRIGYLMGKEGRAFRRLQEISLKYKTPLWSILLVTVTINILIFLFMGLFHGDNALFSFELGLETLTGFATANLLIPLTVVNIALVVSRRKFPDIKRPFRLPLVPLTPIIGIIANLYLVWTLPRLGAISGIVGIFVFMILYLIWGGNREMSEMIRRVDDISDDTEESEDAESEDAQESEEDNYTIMLPARGARNIVDKVESAAEIGKSSDNGKYNITVLYDEQIPEQIPTDQADVEQLENEVSSIESRITDSDIDENRVNVIGHLARSVPLDIVQTARDIEADLILMGYPRDSDNIESTVKTKAPCDVAFERDLTGDAFDKITIGAGSGPHHNALLPVVSSMGSRNSKIFLVSVNPEDGGSQEDVSDSVDSLMNGEDIEFEVQEVSADSVAQGLVEQADKNNSSLMIGATRDSVLRTTLTGSTPDRVSELSYKKDIPILIYGKHDDLTTKLESIAVTAKNTILRIF